MTVASDIELHRHALARIVAGLFAMVGLVEGEAVERLAAPLYRAVLRILRPAESAVRRLIVVVSHGMALKPSVARASCRKAGAANRKCRTRAAAFKLFDPRPRFGSAFRHERRSIRIKLARRSEPRLHVFDVGFDPRVPLFRQPLPIMPEQPSPPPAPDNRVSALRLSRRLMAIKSALDDLPRQARRYLRWQAKPQEQRRPRLDSALRPGKPPGQRRKPSHRVDEILTECDHLARHVARPNTS